MKRVNPALPVPAGEPPERNGAARMTTAKVFAVFASAWPRQEVNESTLNLWAHQIGHITEPEALEAAQKIVRTSEWWPTIRHFLEEAEAIRRRTRQAENRAELPVFRDFGLNVEKVHEIRADLNGRRRGDEVEP